MEVAQIARGIVMLLRDTPERLLDGLATKLLPPLELVETIGFCHDLGHPPFGHGGETALNFAMRDHGGFEGNGQTLRLIARLEATADEFGLDLTRRTMLGVLKYPVSYEKLRRNRLPLEPTHYRQLVAKQWKPPKCYMGSEQDVVEWILQPLSAHDRALFTTPSIAPSDEQHGRPQFKSLDTSIMELADDIAYGVHDFEDGLVLGLVDLATKEPLYLALDRDWAVSVGISDPDATVEALYNTDGSVRKRAIGALVHAFINSVTLMRRERFEENLLDIQAVLDPRAMAFLQRLKDLVTQEVILTHQVQTLEYRGQLLILSLFEALEADPHRLLRVGALRRFTGATAPTEQKRAICDFVAGMTDSYATRLYQRLFVPGSGTVFDHL